MKYTVKTLRVAGLEARWTRTGSGAPIIVARDHQAKHAHQRERWWVVSPEMFETMQRDGIREGFDRHTLLGDVFSVPA